MSFRIIPANIIGRLQALATGQPSEETPGDQPQREHAGKHNDDGHYDPSPIDVAVVRIMLVKATKLPVDIVDGIFEQAEYWVRTTSRADYHARPLRVSKGAGAVQDRFLVRSLPVGFTSKHGGNMELQDRPAQALLLQSPPTAKTLARMADYPLPKLQGPVRKVVFRATGRDQGYANNRTAAEYEDSWTWFEAGLERFEASEMAEPQQTPPTPLDFDALRPVHPTLTNQAPEEGERIEKGAPRDIHNESPIEGEDADRSALRYNFDLLPDPKWLVRRNKRADRAWQEHEIVWSWRDDVKPDSDAGKALEDDGRGRETGSGEFVRNLQVGDVVTLWTKARFPAWVSNVKEASIDVYWAAT